ncbi:hypothetical protein Q1695_008350 [Nippostrongylus brasiliensis]|nr:hypothetical protein Q1695_008350 [Nippostrongylus brasiliensis]
MGMCVGTRYRKPRPGSASCSPSSPSTTITTSSSGGRGHASGRPPTGPDLNGGLSRRVFRRRLAGMMVGTVSLTEPGLLNDELKHLATTLSPTRTSITS